MWVECKDTNGATLQLSFLKDPFSKYPGHVLVVPVFNGSLLLTNHTHRGYEFPGGKIEHGESPIEAAVRELWEETGAITHEMRYVGQYKVISEDGKFFVKSIYFAKVFDIKAKATYKETKGPYLLNHLPKDLKANSDFSFIMKDCVVEEVMKYLHEECLI